MEKPKLSFWQIWNMSFGFLGIQFGFALQNANVSRIFETLGAEIDKIPILWIAAPVTGLIIQPIIGYFSDKTWTRLGRRRPYFLGGAILSSIALIIMPNSPTLWVAAGMLWILDASINISMEPFRAFVGDNLPSEQRTLGFAMQSFFIGTGAIIASALPYILTNWLNISNAADQGHIPYHVKLSFYIGSFVFFFAVLWTVLFSKEYSPEELKKYSTKSENDSYSNNELYSDAKLLKIGLLWLLIGITVVIILRFLFNISDYGLYFIFVGSAIFGIFQILLGTAFKNWIGPKEIVTNIYTMPSTMKQLALAQFFTWFALFAMWIYSTPAVAYYHFGAQDAHSELFNKGADWVGVLMSIYNGFAAIAAFIIIMAAKFIPRKILHAICLIIGGISLISFYIIKDPNLLIIPELGIGLAWASILSMPYAILAGALPFNKMGVYMGIFNFFIVIPQIAAASILGFISKNFFNNNAIYSIVLGGASMIIAAVMMLFVKDVDDKTKK